MADIGDDNEEWSDAHQPPSPVTSYSGGYTAQPASLNRLAAAADSASESESESERPESPANPAEPQSPQSSRSASPLSVPGPAVPRPFSGPASLRSPSGPTSPHTPPGPTSPHTLSDPASPHTPSGPASPRTLSGPTSPRTLSGPASPRTLSGPASPRTLSGPASPRTLSGPTSPRSVPGPTSNGDPGPGTSPEPENSSLTPDTTPHLPKSLEGAGESADLDESASCEEGSRFSSRCSSRQSHQDSFSKPECQPSFRPRSSADSQRSRPGSRTSSLRSLRLSPPAHSPHPSDKSQNSTSRQSSPAWSGRSKDLPPRPRSQVLSDKTNNSRSSKQSAPFLSSKQTARKSQNNSRSSSPRTRGRGTQSATMADEECDLPASEDKAKPSAQRKGKMSRKKLLKAHYEQIRRKGRTRYVELAKPKLPKTDWWTSLYPDVMWGTQDMLFPVPSGAMSANASERVTELATPKKDFQSGTIYESKPLFLYSCGRPSQIWTVAPGAKKGTASSRVEELATPKAFHPDHNPNRPHFHYSCGRGSSVWLVSPGAMQCPERPRTTSLATARPPHREFQPARSIETIISEHALQGKIHDPDYLNNLAQPRRRQEAQFRQPQWDVNPTAMKANATPRVVELARPKGLVEGYQLPRSENTDVPKAARRAVCTTRISELSRPIERASMDHLQFNPDAFLVKPVALKGTFPNRINDLAQPIQR